MLTLAKTCERVETIRQCERNRDWSILALQNIRTGKAHYLVICTCPASGILGNKLKVENYKKSFPFFPISEGPIAQTGAPYAKVPGIRVYGMLCRVNGKKRRRKARVLFGDKEEKKEAGFPPVPDHMWDFVN